MWFLPIIISIVISVALFFYEKNLYSNLKATDQLFLEARLQMLNKFHPYIQVLPNFSNITSNILVKEIVFIIFSLVIHFTDSLIPTYIYIVLVVLTWVKYNTRKKSFPEAKENYPDIVAVLPKAYIILPIFHTILYVLCYLTYMLNK